MVASRSSPFIPYQSPVSLLLPAFLRKMFSIGDCHFSTDQFACAFLGINSEKTMVLQSSNGSGLTFVVHCPNNDIIQVKICIFRSHCCDIGMGEYNTNKCSSAEAVVLVPDAVVSGNVAVICSLGKKRNSAIHIPGDKYGKLPHLYGVLVECWDSRSV